VSEHRRFGRPIIAYPFDSQPRFFPFGLVLTVRVDTSGHVLCYSARDPQRGTDAPLNSQRRALLAELKNWTYTPFLREDAPVAAVLAEYVREEELPGLHVPFPDASVQKTQIELERSSAWSGLLYRVNVSGDGSVLFRGGWSINVQGPHRYQVAPAKVEALIASARDKDLWSVRPEYSSGSSDRDTTFIRIRRGDQTRTIFDYVGEEAGMPAAVTAFEQEIDEVVHARSWVHLGLDALERLQEEHFPFHSRQGGELLLSAIADEAIPDDGVLLQLIQLGAPGEAGTAAEKDNLPGKGSALDAALERRRDRVVSALLARGALQTGGAVSRDKLDRAFRAAIRGGRFALVRMIWEAGGGTMHPALTFVDIAEDFPDRTAFGESWLRRHSPVTLLLDGSTGGGPADGLEIARWLAGKGCDLSAHAADGDTLLHIAAAAGDAPLVRYLLDRGMPASTPGQYGLPALGGAATEEIALMLLAAGTNLATMDGSGSTFRQHAIGQGWDRVVAWLDAHQSPTDGAIPR
jgi:hypothetical protein